MTAGRPLSHDTLTALSSRHSHSTVFTAFQRGAGSAPLRAGCKQRRTGRESRSTCAAASAAAPPVLLCLHPRGHTPPAGRKSPPAAWPPAVSAAPAPASVPAEPPAVKAAGYGARGRRPSGAPPLLAGTPASCLSPWVPAATRHVLSHFCWATSERGHRRERRGVGGAAGSRRGTSSSAACLALPSE